MHVHNLSHSGWQQCGDVSDPALVPAALLDDPFAHTGEKILKELLMISISSFLQAQYGIQVMPCAYRPWPTMGPGVLSGQGNSIFVIVTY